MLNKTLKLLKLPGLVQMVVQHFVLLMVQLIYLICLEIRHKQVVFGDLQMELL